jgi:hypothetical protein
MGLPTVEGGGALASADEAASLELYQVAVEMADRTSSRRATANGFFFTLESGLAAFVAILSSAKRPPSQGNVPTFDAFGLSVTAVAGVILSLTWWVLIRTGGSTGRSSE